MIAKVDLCQTFVKAIFTGLASFSSNSVLEKVILGSNSDPLVSRFVYNPCSGFYKITQIDHILNSGVFTFGHSSS